MELRHLQCLIACAQTKSFSKAASNLFTSQSNVSKMISSLETELGIKLFARKQHGIELTEKGRQIYKYALSITEVKDKILHCAEEEEAEELRLCFQPSSWFASAFCDYYLRTGSSGKRYFVTSASVDEIIRRLNNDLDQLGFAYVEEEHLTKIRDVLQTNHISYYVLSETRNVLYYGVKTSMATKELLLIQGEEDSYSGLSSWKEQLTEESGTDGADAGIKPKVVISTNSDYIMQEILKRTELSNIRPENISASERNKQTDSMQIEVDEKKILYICMFRNDHSLERFPKDFLAFIRRYLKE